MAYSRIVQPRNFCTEKNSIAKCKPFSNTTFIVINALFYNRHRKPFITKRIPIPTVGRTTILASMSVVIYTRPVCIPSNNMKIMIACTLKL